MLKIKQFAAIAMSFLMTGESFTYANTKNSVSGLHNFFKNNLKETVALGSGGIGALALLLTVVACSNKKTDNSCGANAAQITRASILDPIFNSVKKLNHNVKKSDKERKFNAELILASCLDLPTEPKSTVNSEDKHEDEPSKASDATSDLSVVPESEEYVEDHEKSDREDDDKAKSVYDADSDDQNATSEAKEQTPEEEEELDWYDDDECEGVYGSDSDDQDDEDSEKECVGEVLDFEKNGVLPEFSPELSNKIKLLCGDNEQKITYMETLIMMLSKLKNDNHKPEDKTSLVEANFIRCERQFELYRMGNRVFNQYDLLLLIRLADDIVDLSESGYWETVKKILFRGVEVHGTRLEFNPNKVIAGMRQ